MSDDEAKRIQELEEELARLKKVSGEDSERESDSEEAETVPSTMVQSEPKQQKKSRLLLIILIALALVVVVIVAILITRLTRPNPAAEALQEAYEICGEPEGIYLLDDGAGLSFDNKGEEDSFGASVESIVCVLLALDVPETITNHISQTTSLDGRQSAEWDDYEIQWSYHPRRGLDGVITIQDK